MMDEAVSSPSFRPNRVFGSPTVKPVGIATLILGLIIAGSRLLAFAHAQTETGKWQTPLPVIVLGTIIGMTYGLLAVGLVLIYRSNRIINFAHGQIGAFGAAFFGIAVVRWHLPYWVGVPIALALAGGVGAAAETGVVRRLRKAPRLMSVVATLGVGQFLLLFAAALNGQAGLGARYPEPLFVPTFTIYDANRDLMRARQADWHKEYTWKSMWDYFTPQRGGHGSYWYRWSTQNEIEWKENYRLWMAFINEYKNRGGRVCTGSDSGFIYQIFGFGYIRELELLQEAGFHPLEVIQSATMNGGLTLYEPVFSGLAQLGCQNLGQCIANG